jgi:ubiquinone/menaquinone biosynthesis C-methylase UbiE
MAGSPLRQLAYRHRWIYDAVTATSALSVGGVGRLRALAAEWMIPLLPKGSPVLDLCCGSGEAAAPLLQADLRVTGLDIAPSALELAALRHSDLTLVQGLAEDPPLPDSSFAGIQLSLALHEFPAAERRELLRSARRLLQPGGVLVMVDLHPAAGLMKPMQQLFCALFETETATAFLQLDLPQELADCGLQVERHELLAGTALQRLLCRPQPASP